MLLIYVDRGPCVALIPGNGTENEGVLAHAAGVSALGFVPIATAKAGR